MLRLLSCLLAAFVSVLGDSVTVGDTRVTALSPTLIRIEPRGPRGFEDGNTFVAAKRSTFGAGTPIKTLNSTVHGSWLATADLHIYLSATAGKRSCGKNVSGRVDALPPIERSAFYPNGTHVSTAAACCKLCLAAADCTSWVFNPNGPKGKLQCFPLKTSGGPDMKPKRTETRVYGQVTLQSQILIASATTGATIWPTSSDKISNKLHWPSPLAAKAYAVVDSPRFTVPAWGPTPIPPGATVDPALEPTNGYDFRNNPVSGNVGAGVDMYVFVLGDDLESWYHSRGEYLQLAGPTPLLPDWSYGAWYTWYIKYTEEEAKADVMNWTTGKYPLDVWALDMEWRNHTYNESKKLPAASSCRNQTNFPSSPLCQDHFYNAPNTTLFPGLGGSNDTSAEWFEWLHSKGLKTYFNDHPFPHANAATPAEVSFRYEGLTTWMKRGLDYWWFDHNWEFTLPVPLQDPRTKADWDGLTGEVWGSHVYYEVTAALKKQQGLGERPISLTRDNGPNWTPGMSNDLGNGVAGHHRYPVWWTGDGVELMASVETMVDESVHDFQPFVHSDCGGHRGGHSKASKAVVSDENLLRWTSHCVFGTIIRFHQGDHRPWLRPKPTQDEFRALLQLRYRLAPSLIAAGVTVQQAGFPLVARCDLVWPEYATGAEDGQHSSSSSSGSSNGGSSSNTQYLHLNATLVAPLGDHWQEDQPSKSKSTDDDSWGGERTVWIPPGDWHSVWDGTTVTGPKTIHASASNGSHILAWHKGGSIIATVEDPDALRVSRQNWSTLTAHAFPMTHTAHESYRDIYESENENKIKGDNAGFGGGGGGGVQTKTKTRLSLKSDGRGGVSIGITRMSTSMSMKHEQLKLQIERDWIIRIHLRPGQRVLSAAIAVGSISGVVAAANSTMETAEGDIGSIDVVHVEPLQAGAGECGDVVPFGGQGTPSACGAGPIAEVHVQHGSGSGSGNGSGSVVIRLHISDA